VKETVTGPRRRGRTDGAEPAGGIASGRDGAEPNRAARWRDDWLQTVRQTLPRILELARNFRPTLHLESVAAIDPGILRSYHVQGIIWDVDGTLMPYHNTRVSPELEPAFQALLAAPDVRHVLLSNSGERRFRELGAIFPEIPVLRAYTSPRGILCRRLLGQRDSWSEAELASRLTAGARAIRKPNPILIEHALREMGELRREDVVLIGDQYFTDVAGANLAGIRSIKVRTLARETFPAPVRLLQRIEELAYRVLYGPPSRGGTA
jgi:HAD superfamily phosphatase (TIGR01668 family)